MIVVWAHVGGGSGVTKGGDKESGIPFQEGRRIGFLDLNLKEEFI